MNYEIPWKVASQNHCVWYHTFDLPGVGFVQGDWDLRPCIHDYLGRYDFKGKRVLDIGTASGFLSFHCEQAGAREVVSVDYPMQLAPGWGDDFSGIARMKNGYWFAHKALNSKAKVFYGNVYDLPDELGKFDVALLGSILLHLENPYGGLRNAAKLADTLIVTDATRPYYTGTGMMFRPAWPNPDHMFWWYIPLEQTVRMLSTLGYKVAEPVWLRPLGPKFGSVDLYALVATR
jgi:SAM-dependent methyltransferase